MYFIVDGIVKNTYGLAVLGFHFCLYNSLVI